MICQCTFRTCSVPPQRLSVGAARAFRFRGALDATRLHDRANLQLEPLAGCLPHYLDLSPSLTPTLAKGTVTLRLVVAPDGSVRESRVGDTSLDGDLEEPAHFQTPGMGSLAR